jgi:hypothetical protein
MHYIKLIRGYSIANVSESRNALTAQPSPNPKEKREREMVRRATQSQRTDRR